MAEVKVKQFTYRSIVDRDTIIIEIIADGKSINNQKFPTVNYTVQQAIDYLKFNVETFGQSDSENENIYVLDKTSSTSPSNLPPTTSTSSNPSPRSVPANIRIPQNQIIKSKYTAGKEYIFEKSYREYTGYYYELNGKKYAGKEYNTNSPVLIPIKSPNINKLLTTAATYVYGKISNVALPVNIKFKPIPINTPSSSSNNFKYFSKKNNTNPVKIICISEEEYIEGKRNNNPLYSFTAIEFNEEWGFIITDQNKKDIPEIEVFLQNFDNN